METSCLRTGNTRATAYDAWKVRQVVDVLVSLPSSARTARELVAHRDSPGTSPFERYAGCVLHDAQVMRLADSPRAASMLIVPPDARGRVRLQCAEGSDCEELHRLANAESALNRLIGISDALMAGTAGANASRTRPVGISWAGVGFLPTADENRVPLPDFSPNLPREARLNELDWRVIDDVAGDAHRVFQMSLLHNAHQSLMGAWAPDGSDWDVRTRMAANLGRLGLALHSDFLFDCDMEARAVSVRFAVPLAGSFPTKVVDLGRNALADSAPRIAGARAAYSLRLACLLAAACFGAGKQVERAYVVGELEDCRCVLSCAFSRDRYVRDTLVTIDSRALSAPELRFDPQAVAALVRADELRLADFGEAGSSVEPIDDQMGAHRVPVHLDERPLPETMQRLFHAQRVCDIGAGRASEGGTGEISVARADADESPLAAIARLERIADELEGALDAPDDDAGARPLYCPNPFARLAVSLADDELSVGEQAQAFLDGDGGAARRTDERPLRYFRAPGELFHAHLGLSDLYERLGDFRGAEAQADRCIELAPTAAQAHFRKADVLAQQGRFGEAANVLVAGLENAIAESDCALLYYHLALVLWNLGMKRTSAAVHVYTASLTGEHAGKAREAVAHLRKHGDKPVIAFASPQAAAREMARARIPVAPSDEARALVAKAALGLACANAPAAAAPYAAACARRAPDDAVLQAAARSLQ